MLNRVRYLLFVLFAAVSCDSPDLIPLAETDRFVVSVTPNTAGNSFKIHVRTNGAYGCESSLSISSGRNAQALILQVNGILEGTEGCAGTPAVSRTDFFPSITNRFMYVQLFYLGRRDVFLLRADSQRNWTVEESDLAFSSLQLNAPQ